MDYVNPDSMVSQLVQTFTARMKPDKPIPERDDFTLYYRAVLEWEFPHHLHPLVETLCDNSVRTAVFLLPPGHGKTVLLSAFAAWTLGNNPNTRVIIATHTETYSERILNFITTLLAHPESKRIFGNLIPQRSLASTWTQKQKTILRSDYRLKDPSLLALSVGSSTIGYRCDLIIGDDLVSYANSLTQVMRGHVHHWYFSSLDKRLDPGGRIRIFGARFYKQDLYGAIKDLSSSKTIEMVATPEEPLWPERFTSEDIARAEEEDYFSYVGQYLQTPVDFTRNFLKEDWLFYYLEPPSNLRVYIGVDPCARDKHGTNYLAISVIGFDVNNTGYILDVQQIQASTTDHKYHIVAAAKLWKPVLIGIETNSAQQYIMDDILKDVALPIRGIQTQLPKSIRFASMASLFKSQKILLPGVVQGESIKPHPKVTEFVKQWISFPSPDADILDATELGVSTALNIGVIPASVVSIPTVTRETEGERYRRRLGMQSKLRHSFGLFH